MRSETDIYKDSMQRKLDQFKKWQQSIINDKIKYQGKNIVKHCAYKKHQTAQLNINYTIKT